MKLTLNTLTRPFLLAALCSTLVACSEPKTESVRVNAPANALSKCPDLRDPLIGESQEHYRNYLIDTYYGKCALPHDALIKFNSITK